MNSINKINNYANNNKDKMSLPQLHRETQEGGLVLSANVEKIPPRVSTLPGTD